MLVSNDWLGSLGIFWLLGKVLGKVKQRVFGGLDRCFIWECWVDGVGEWNWKEGLKKMFLV